MMEELKSQVIRESKKTDKMMMIMTIIVMMTMIMKMIITMMKVMK